MFSGDRTKGTLRTGAELSHRGLVLPQRRAVPLERGWQGGAGYMGGACLK